MHHTEGLVQAHIAAPNAVTGDHLDGLQLRRLAAELTGKPAAEIIALARNNPELVREWMLAFQACRAQAEEEAKCWAAAVDHVRRGTVALHSSRAAE